MTQRAAAIAYVVPAGGSGGYELRVLCEGTTVHFPLDAGGLARLAAESAKALHTMAQQDGWIVRRGLGAAVKETAP